MIGLTPPKKMVPTMISTHLVVVDDEWLTDLSKLGTLRVSGSLNFSTDGAEQPDTPVLVNSRSDLMTKAGKQSTVFAQRVRKLSASELQQVAGGTYEVPTLLKQGGGQDFTGRQGFE